MCPQRQEGSRIPPSKVQQDWPRIIRLVETPAAEVKPRGKSPGRQSGETQTPRQRQPVNSGNVQSFIIAIVLNRVTADSRIL